MARRRASIASQLRSEPFSGAKRSRCNQNSVNVSFTHSRTSSSCGRYRAQTAHTTGVNASMICAIPSCGSFFSSARYASSVRIVPSFPPKAYCVVLYFALEGASFRLPKPLRLQTQRVKWFHPFRLRGYGLLDCSERPLADAPVQYGKHPQKRIVCL